MNWGSGWTMDGDGERTDPLDERTPPFPARGSGFVPWQHDGSIPGQNTAEPSSEREQAFLLERERIDDAASAAQLLHGQTSSLGPSVRVPDVSRASTPLSQTPAFPAPASAVNAPLGSFPMPSARRADLRRADLQDSSRAHGRRDARNPDGTPAQLPFTSRESRTRERGGARQRFSGSGVTEHSVAQRQERRARAMTLALAALAALLVLSSAFVLFNPFVGRFGFGFALGQRLIHLSNGQILVLPGTGSVITPSPALASPTSTPLGQPTVTPVPQKSPTPTPTLVPPTNAVISFTAVSSKQATNGSMTACTSGCTLPSYSLSGAYRSSHQQGTTGTYYYNAWVPLNAQVTAIRICDVNLYACHSGGGTFPGAAVTFDSSGLTNGSCTANLPSGNFAHDTSQPCQMTSHSVSRNQYSGTAGWCGEVDKYGNMTCWTFAWYNEGGTGGTAKYVTYADCHSAMSTANLNGQATVSSIINNWAAGKALAPPTMTTDPNSYDCPPEIGSVGSTVTGYATIDYSATDFDPQAAVAYASGLLNTATPVGYYLSAGPTGCTQASAVQWSYAGGTFTVSCMQSGTVTYDWRSSSSAGQQAQQKLAVKLAGMSYQSALAFCNGGTGEAAGIVKGSCTIKLGAGNQSQMPMSAGQITVIGS